MSELGMMEDSGESMNRKKDNNTEEIPDAEKTAEASAAAGIRCFYAEQTDMVVLKQRFTAFLMEHGSGSDYSDGSVSSSGSSSSRTSIAAEIWETLNSSYCEPRRFYHSWGHIAFMLQLMDNYRDVLAADQLPRHPVPFEAAVWFHDAVQFSGREGEDERRSADLAVRLLRRTGMQIDYVLRAAELIRSTQLLSDSSGFSNSAAGEPEEASGKSKKEPGSGRSQDADPDLLHDLDYAVMGTSEKLFLAYEQAVRYEYAHLSDEEYAAGRSSFLRTLQREGVFRTEYFTAEYEDQALNNIRMQLERFRKFSGRS